MAQVVGEDDPATRLMLSATWDDAPHLSELERRELFRSIPEFQREARTQGIPYLGSGLIYPFGEKDIVVKDFDIPTSWPRGYGMDVGWNRTAAAFLAHDRQSDTLYLYYAYSRGHGEPPSHASAILALGKWIPGRIDPASNGRSQIDGKRLMTIYTGLGLQLNLAPNAVEAGILAIYSALSKGKLKVFESCHAWFEEYRVYARNDDGKVVKDNDHLMDATRYFMLALIGNANWLMATPVEGERVTRYVTQGQAGQEWMQ
jgi:hypothetical protein